MYVDVGAGGASVVVVVVVDEAEVARDRELEPDAGDQLLVGHVRVAVVADELVERGELNVLQVERRRRPLHVEVLYTRRMSTPSTHRSSHQSNGQWLIKQLTATVEYKT